MSEEDSVANWTIWVRRKPENGSDQTLWKRWREGWSGARWIWAGSKPLKSKKKRALSRAASDVGGEWASSRRRERREKGLDLELGLARLGIWAIFVLCFRPQFQFVKPASCFRSWRWRNGACSPLRQSSSQLSPLLLRLRACPSRVSYI